MTRISTALAALLAAAVVTLIPASAHADRGDFPDPVHPCLQAPCPPAGTSSTHGDFPGPVYPCLQEPCPPVAVPTHGDFPGPRPIRHHHHGHR